MINQFFQKIAASEDVLENILASGSHTFKNGRKSWILECPDCGKMKLWIRKKDGIGCCFRCGTKYAGKSLLFLLSRIYGIEVDVLQELLYNDTQQFNTEFDDLIVSFEDYFETEDKDEVTVDQIEIPDNIVFLSHPHAWAGVEYLKKRGVSIEIAEHYDVRYDIEQRRVVFPVKNGDYWVGWQGRWIGDPDSIDAPRRIDTRGQINGKYIMFDHRLKGIKHAIITEGPFDAIKCHLCGGNTATMGKTLSDQQVKIYKNSDIDRLYVGLDNDAFIENENILRQLDGYMEVYRLKTPPGREDLGASTFEEVKQSFEQSKNFFSSSERFVWY